MGQPEETQKFHTPIPVLILPSIDCHIKGVGGGGLGIKILFDLVATYFKNLGYREIEAFYGIENPIPVAKF